VQLPVRLNNHQPLSLHPHYLRFFNSAMTKQGKAELFLLLVTLIWGSTFVITKYVLQDSGPFLYTAIRFLIASVIFAAIFFPRIRTINTSSFLKGAILGFLLFIGFATQTVGLLYTTASKSAFITGMMVVFTPICQMFIERKYPNAGNLIGVVLVTIGLYSLTSPTGAHFNVGDGLTLICALSFGFYIVYLDIFSQECEPAQLTFIQFVTTAALAGISFLFFEDFRWRWTIHLTLEVLYLALFATVIAIYVQAKYQKDTTPTRSAVIFSVEPVIASVFAYFLLEEHVGNAGLAGAALIFCGVIVSEFSESLIKAFKIAG
jgi:drug/metabolite transporter (DMT)-like permease